MPEEQSQRGFEKGQKATVGCVDGNALGAKGASAEVPGPGEEGEGETRQ